MPIETEPDAYAATYMKGSGRVLVRDKATSRVSFALLAFFTVWTGAGAVAAFAQLLPKASLGVALFLTAISAFFGLLTVGLTVLRTVVSERELFVQYDLWGPRIPIEQITRCEVVPYDWKRFGGWGIKRSGDGVWAYTLSARGDVVEVAWKDADGKEHCAQFSASDPAAVAGAVARARDAAASRVRVAVEDAGPSATIDSSEGAEESRGASRSM